MMVDWSPMAQSAEEAKGTKKKGEIRPYRRTSASDAKKKERAENHQRRQNAHGVYYSTTN